MKRSVKGRQSQPQNALAAEDRAQQTIAVREGVFVAHIQLAVHE